jgi:cysteinyl-tRNA synthetase
LTVLRQFNGNGDPRDVVAPYAEAPLAVRRSARAARDLGTADAIRDQLEAAGVQVPDTPDGVSWGLERPHIGR